MRNVDEWPIVLAGPMLRKVDAKGVSVFVALSRPGRVRLLLLDDAGVPVPLSSDGDRATVPLGVRLHVAVLTARPATPLAPGRNYSYDLVVTAFDDLAVLRVYDLAALGLLAAPHLLGYEAGRRPTFALAATLDKLNVVYGSCRKPHGGGPDALALADDLIHVTRRADGTPDPDKRPHQLLLTGDQIYADDVALPLARLIVETGRALVASWSPTAGWDGAYLEGIPLGEVGMDDPRRAAYASADVEPGAARRSFVKHEARLTSDHADGHLLFLAEFYAMYLLAWSDELWPRQGSRWLEMDPPPGLEDDALEEAEEVTKELHRFADTLRKVRRALANTPTLTMFDDHEVTDDWNLDATAASTTRRRAAGQRVLRNGLLAYAVFQDWGNQPEDYEAGRHGASILSALRCAPGLTDYDSATGPPPILADPGSLHALLDLDPDAPNRVAAARKRWDYVHRCDGHQRHQIVALDTRTWRDLPDGWGHAGLLNADAVGFQLDARRPAAPWPPTANDPFTLLIAPAPLFGVAAIEAIQDSDLRAGDPYGNDAETWMGNAAACKRFLDALVRFRSIVVLSGDVHYAFTNHAAVSVATPEGFRQGRIVHACGTALKNADRLTRAAQLLGARPGRYGILGEEAFVEAILERLDAYREANRNAVHLMDTVNDLTHVFRTSDKARRVAEVTLTLQGMEWQDLRDLFATQPAGAAYRLHWCEHAAGPVQVVQHPPAPGDRPLGDDPWGLGPHRLLSRTIVGAPNLGVLTLALDAEGAPRQARIRIHHRFGSTVLVTEHEAPLTPATREDVGL